MFVATAQIAVDKNILGRNKNSPFW